MYMCFDDDDKRSAFPEASLISMDENGYTLKSGQSRNGNTVFLKQRAFKGAVQNFNQALNWVRNGSPKKTAAPAAEALPDNPSF